MAVEIKLNEPAPDRTCLAWEVLRPSGLLWLINRVVFHPRGFALAFEYDGPAVEGREPVGWSLQGDGSEVWQFSAADEDALFAAAEETFSLAREHGCLPAPPEGHSTQAEKRGAE